MKSFLTVQTRLWAEWTEGSKQTKLGRTRSSPAESVPEAIRPSRRTFHLFSWFILFQKLHNQAIFSMFNSLLLSFSSRWRTRPSATRRRPPSRRSCFSWRGAARRCYSSICQQKRSLSIVFTNIIMISTSKAPLSFPIFLICSASNIHLCLSSSRRSRSLSISSFSLPTCLLETRGRIKVSSP